MKFSVTPEAVKYFLEEMELKKGTQVRIYVKYGGKSTIHTSYSLGIMMEPSSYEGASFDAEGLHFYIEKDDMWYFADHDMEIGYNPDTQEIEFNYFER